MEVESGLVALATRLKALEEQLRDLDYEKGYIVCPDGSIRQEAQGSEVDVYLRLASMQPGEVSVHNHVRNGWSPPSPDDWQMMLQNPVGEMRVVSADWTYVLKAPREGWPLRQRFRRYWTGEKVRFSMNLKEMVSAVPRRIEDMLPHWYSPERRRAEGSELMHQAWGSIATEVGAAYWREPAWEAILKAKPLESQIAPGD